ncbi:hypothetical protein ACF0H5_014735 [Mactra antiquata]
MTTGLRGFEFFLFLTIGIVCQVRTIVVDTENGQVRGITREYNGQQILQFKKIPFAVPPIGENRFRKPQPYGKWNGVLNATKLGPSCMQHLLGNDEWLLENKNVSEDCLHLNIYVPKAIDKKNPKAVMVWIYGGGFTAGQATLVDGSYLALQGDVIVVMVNYRIGLFGFLSTEDVNAPGNYGLWDQKLGMQWVHDNIHNFGGDNKRVCIFGESAGGYSVGLQSIIPSNKGLFQRVISESGAVKSPRALAVGSRSIAIEAGRLLNCDIENITKLMECLRSVQAEQLLQIQGSARHVLDDSDTFISRLGPVLDNDLITIDPGDLLLNVSSEHYQFFKSLDVMAGTNNAEGGLMYWRMMQYQLSKNFNISEGISKQALCEVVAPLVADDYYNSSNIVSQAICDLYTVPGNDLAEQGRSTVNVYADMQFIMPTIETLIAHSLPLNNQQPTSGTYQYIFSHQPSYNWIQDRPPWLQGANHAGELPFVFGLDAMYKTTSTRPHEEIALSKQMMTYWSNFAKTGNPNKGATDDLIEWPQFGTTNRRYMNISIPVSAGEHMYADRTRLWTVTLPSMSNPMIETTNGKVRGFFRSYSGKQVLQFKGIPYAKPPIGELRFSKPLKHPSWEAVLDAFNLGSVCTQINSVGKVSGSEDCLYLNIYIPYGIDKYDTRAVMIWIHGGAFHTGSGNIDASNLALAGNVIVVTINYRLGLFGFLSTEDDSALGNYGLWDQKMAIQWIHDNAHTFGGDKNRICLFGESAGGYSVGLQMIHSKNAGLFQRAITESGTVLSPRAISEDSFTVAIEAAKRLNCPTKTTELVKCLRNKSSRSLINVQTHAIYGWDSSENMKMRLGPVIDNDFIIDSPENIVHKPNSDAYEVFANLDILAGSNNAEGALMNWRIKRYENQYKFNIEKEISRRVLCEVIAPAAVRTYFSKSQALQNAICEQYSIGNDSGVKQAMSAMNVYADLFFNIPTRQTLMSHVTAQGNNSNTKTTYQYLFSHKPSTQKGPSWLTGATHGAEVAFVFGLGARYSANEKELSEKIMLYWTNFAKTGDPNNGSTKQLEVWPQFSASRKAYMDLSTPIHSGSDLYGGRMKFWLETVPELIKKENDSANSANSLIIPMDIIVIHTFLVLFYMISSVLV